VKSVSRRVTNVQSVENVGIVGKPHVVPMYINQILLWLFPLVQIVKVRSKVNVTSVARDVLNVTNGIVEINVTNICHVKGPVGKGRWYLKGIIPVMNLGSGCSPKNTTGSL
jgi:hypothetical protein